MKTLFAFIFSLTICTLNAQQDSTIADNNNLAAFKLYEKIDTTRNLFFSPFCISTAMAMTYAGARNETEKQMSRAFYFSLAQDTFHQEYKTYLEKIEGDTGKDAVIDIANALYVANIINLLEPFSTIAKTDYNAEIKNVDFYKPEQTRQEINLWVEKRTNDKIKNLIKPGILDAKTRVVLVNAIYFKGKWNVPFLKDSTKKEEFYKNNSSSTKADLMHNTAHYKYYEDAHLQAIELPYAGEKMSMVVLLPKDTNGMDSMEIQLDHSYYSKIVSSMSNQKVKVALPEFKTTCAFELNDVLSAMGMPVAFSVFADFSGMCTEVLYISHVIHKAFIDVNEEGTEATAATVISVAKVSARFPRPKVPVFNANHPFVFVIRDNATGSILFMGKITDPTKE